MSDVIQEQRRYQILDSDAALTVIHPRRQTYAKRADVGSPAGEVMTKRARRQGKAPAAVHPPPHP